MCECVSRIDTFFLSVLWFSFWWQLVESKMLCKIKILDYIKANNKKPIFIYHFGILRRRKKLERATNLLLTPEADIKSMFRVTFTQKEKKNKISNKNNWKLWPRSIDATIYHRMLLFVDFYRNQLNIWIFRLEATRKWNFKWVFRYNLLGYKNRRSP